MYKRTKIDIKVSRDYQQSIITYDAHNMSSHGSLSDYQNNKLQITKDKFMSMIIHKWNVTVDDIKFAAYKKASSNWKDNVNQTSTKKTKKIIIF